MTRCSEVKYAVTVLQRSSRCGGVSSTVRRGQRRRFNQERVMKSRVINPSRALSLWPLRGFARLSQTGVAFGATLCALTLSGCYYPYGYYPSGYYSPYYATRNSCPAERAWIDGSIRPATAASSGASATAKPDICSSGSAACLCCAAVSCLLSASGLSGLLRVSRLLRAVDRNRHRRVLGRRLGTRRLGTLPRALSLAASSSTRPPSSVTARQAHAYEDAPPRRRHVPSRRAHTDSSQLP
jgi:hypothetical protein